MSLFQFIFSKKFLVQLAIAGIFAVVFFFVVSKWLNIATNHGQKIEVPNLAKLSMEEVESTLDELELTFVILDSASFNPNYPKKSVIDQTPKAGDFVKEKRKIYLTLNPSGYRNVEIPNLFGKTKRQATSQLMAIGFRVDTTYLYVPDIAKDVVRGIRHGSTDLKAGDAIPKNSLLKLRLGDGKGTTRYREE